MIVTREELEKALRNFNYQTVNYTEWNRQRITKEIRSNGYLYAILQTISRATNPIGYMVGKAQADGSFQEDLNNPLYKALKSPNPTMSHKRFRSKAAFEFHSWGEIFIFFERYEAGNNKGQIIPESISLLPTEITDIKVEGTKVIGYVVDGDTTRTISPDNVLHIKNDNPKWDDFHGLSPIAVAGSMIDKLNAANETETKTFQNSGPAYLISAKEIDSFEDHQYLSFMQRLRKSWSNIRNKRGIVGTSGQVEVHPLGMSPSDMGTIESQKNTVKALLTIWGLDAGLFDTDASTYNNKMLMNKQTYTEVVIPFCDEFYGAFERAFGKTYGDVIINIDTSDVEALQPNYREKAEWMEIAGCFTDNEKRYALNYDKRESPESDLTPNERMSSDIYTGFSDDNLNSEVVES